MVYNSIVSIVMLQESVCMTNVGGLSHITGYKVRIGGDQQF